MNWTFVADFIIGVTAASIIIGALVAVAVSLHNSN